MPQMNRPANNQRAPASTGFLPFLAQDDASSIDPAADRVVQLINQDLGQLLRQDAAGFWRVVRQDRSLQTCLDSYLQNCRRPFDELPSGAGSASQTQARSELAKRVFLVLYRLVDEAGASGPGVEASQLLYNRQLLSVPKLLDICVLYGHDNPALTQQLMHKVFRLQPKLVEQLQRVLPTAVQNLRDVQDAMTSRAQDLGSSRQSDDLVEGLTDGVVYLRDVCLTLAAFTEALPPAAPLLLADSCALLSCLAAAHDGVAPALAKALQRAAGPAASQAQKLLRLMELSAEHLAAQLLRAAFLERPAGDAASLPGAMSEAAHMAPSVRGEHLMEALITLGSSPAAQANSDADGRQHVLAAVSSRHQLPTAIAEARRQGVLALDEAQQDYLTALLGAAPSLPAASPDQLSTSGPSVANGVDDAVLASCISQIRELLPDYGEGFLATCLEAFSYQPEEVINRLLEGSLPAHLACLDQRMPLSAFTAARTAPSGPEASSASSLGAQAAALSAVTGNFRRDKGKAQAEAAVAAEAGPSFGTLSWVGLASEAEQLSSSTSRHANGNAAPSSRPQSKKAHKATSRALDTLGKDDAVRAAVRLAADAAQWEYEDEYDDSFDSLAQPGADGLADAEGDDEDFHPTSYTTAMQSSAPQQRQPQQQQQQRGSHPLGGPANAPGRGKAKVIRQWVLDGRVYNYKKEGALEVTSQAGTQAALEAAKAAAQAIHGLGPGGNVPIQSPQPARPASTGPPVSAFGGLHQPGDGGGAGGSGSSAAGPSHPPGSGRGSSAGAAERGRAARGRGGAGSHGSRPAAADQDPGEGPNEAGSSGGRGRGGGRGHGGGGRDGNAPRHVDGTWLDHRRKDQNKAAVGNHHRKDRALKKMAGL